MLRKSNCRHLAGDSGDEKGRIQYIMVSDLCFQKGHLLLQVSNDTIPLLDDGPGILQLWQQTKDENTSCGQRLTQNKHRSWHAITYSWRRYFLFTTILQYFLKSIHSCVQYLRMSFALQKHPVCFWAMETSSAWCVCVCVCTISTDTCSIMWRTFLCWLFNMSSRWWIFSFREATSFSNFSHLQTTTF